MTLDAINAEKLGHHLHRRRRHLDVDLRTIGDETGVSSSTLSRIERNVGGTPDTETLAAICTWLNMPVAAFLNSNANRVTHRRGASLIEQIEAVLDADPTLDRAAKDALADLMAAALAQVK